MAIRSIDDANAAAALSQTAKQSGSSALGKDEFLRLLTTQLQYQDPMAPMDNTQFTAQLAQFSSLEQLFSVNDNLLGLSLAQAPSGMASVAGFLDRDVVAQGNRVVLGENGASPIQFVLDGRAEIVNVTIKDASGVTVRNLPLGALPGGAQSGGWDGLDNLGRSQPAGDYTFTVTAQDDMGDTVPTHTEVRGRVTGAIYNGGNAYLTVGAHQVALTDVLSVSTAN